MVVIERCNLGIENRCELCNKLLPMSTKHPIREYREKRKLKLRELATDLGINKGTLSRWERGQIAIPPERLDLIERITRISRRKLRPDIFAQPKGA